jgi:cytochrome c-type biogenesis protein CcmH/NrfG
MLKVWRNKILKIPKSGELWCEGGRIYLNLLEYNNAIKCFHYAIHFTPQFGDSFF